MTKGRARRGRIAILMVLICLAGLAIGGRALWDAARSAVKADGCTFGSYNLDLNQAATASTMTSVVLRRGLPERAAVLVLGAALQESKLRNIPSGEGDRDSVGVLQQRPSQGWGKAAQLADVGYATGRFLDALVKLPQWQTDTMANAIQDVQISAEGAAYAKHEDQAVAIADALTGKTAAGVTCNFKKPTAVAAASTVVSRLKLDLPVSEPTTSDKAIGVPGASWATAAWFVTHADQYGIDSVRYSAKEWTRSKGWRTKQDVAATSVQATLRS